MQTATVLTLAALRQHVSWCVARAKADRDLHWDGASQYQRGVLTGGCAAYHDAQLALAARQPHSLLTDMERSAAVAEQQSTPGACWAAGCRWGRLTALQHVLAQLPLPA